MTDALDALLAFNRQVLRQALDLVDAHRRSPPLHGGSRSAVPVCSRVSDPLRNDAVIVGTGDLLQIGSLQRAGAAFDTHHGA